MRVDLDCVTVRLADEPVLRDVTATVEPGRFVGLVGPNGAGKTTLLRTVSGRITPESGTVRVGGDDVHALSSRAASRRVATVPQDRSLSFGFTVREIVEMGRHPHRSRFGHDPAIAGSDSVSRAGTTDPVTCALERTATDHLADRPITETSGGERQRALLARALAQDAPVLLLDEPTASLDVTHQVRTMDLVADLAAGGRTVVAAIHDLTLAARYCDDLLLLADGEVVEYGPPGSVLREDALAEAFGTGTVVARHPTTGTPLVTAVPEDRNAHGTAEITADREARVHVLGGDGAATPLLERLHRAGFAVTVGPVARNDPDHETADRLGIEAVAVEPFSPIDDDAREAVAERIARADATVLADVTVYPGSAEVLSLLDRAAHPVVVETRPFAERNRAGERARRRYERLRSRALVVGPDDDPLAVVGTAVAADDAPRSVAPGE